MKAFLASLLAVAAFAEEVVYELVNEESEMLSWTWDFGEGEYTPYENQGEFMSLTTTLADGDDEIEFCFTVEATGTAAGDYAYLGVEYTDGPVTSLKSADYNGLVFYIYDDSGSWGYDVDYGYHADDADAWTIDTDVTVWECDEAGDCVGLFCATRALEVDGFYTLPFDEGTNFRAVFSTESGFDGVVYSGAMSLGLALAATAGAALTLV